MHEAGRRVDRRHSGVSQRGSSTPTGGGHPTVWARGEPRGDAVAVRGVSCAPLVAFGGVGGDRGFAPVRSPLRGLSLFPWNLGLLSQPILHLVAVIVWYLAAPFTVLAASICLLISYTMQLLFAYASGRRAMLETTGTASVTAGDLLRFGLKQASSAVPQSLAGCLDRIVLSQAGNPAALGRYRCAQPAWGAAPAAGPAHRPGAPAGHAASGTTTTVNQ